MDNDWQASEVWAAVREAPGRVVVADLVTEPLRVEAVAFSVSLVLFARVVFGLAVPRRI